MAKYSKYQKKSVPRPETNPIWRGIGCILIVIVPIMSYGLMTILAPLMVGTGLVPDQILGRVKLPPWSLKTPMLSGVTSYIGGINDLWFKLIAFFVILLLLTAIFSLIYSMVFQLVGPPRYSEMDAPPPKYKGKTYKR